MDKFCVQCGRPEVAHLQEILDSTIYRCTSCGHKWVECDRISELEQQLKNCRQQTIRECVEVVEMYCTVPLGSSGPCEVYPPTSQGEMRKCKACEIAAKLREGG